jgi:hypothetical protein
MNMKLLRALNKISTEKRS